MVNLSPKARLNPVSLGPGVTLMFSSCVGLDPASTVYPLKYQENQALRNIFYFFFQSNKISPICTFTLKKRC